MKNKKLLSILLAAAVTAASVLPSGAVAASAKGDIDGDGVIAAADLNILQEHILGNKDLTAGQTDAADVNDDGSINVYDVVALRKLILSTPRELDHTDATDRMNSGYSDAVKKLALEEGGAAVKSTSELKAALSPYFSESVVNEQLKKYSDSFFNESVLIVKPFYFDPDEYAIPHTVTRLSCGCSTSYAGTYTTKNVTSYLNIRKEHSASSESIGRIPPNAVIPVSHGSGQWAHVTYNGISGYANMDYMQKTADPATEYKSVPGVKITSVSYADGKVTVSASQYVMPESAEFCAASIVKAVIPKDEYYAQEANWTVSTTATTTTTTTTTTTVQYPLAEKKLNEIGRDLKAAFTAASSITYYGHTPDMPQDDNTSMEWYADYGFTNGKGNCYVMAAMFCEMAKLLGYDAHQISGRVPLMAGGYGPHSWVEITVNGTVYVCDPDFAQETNLNGYMITYGQSGTWMYVKDSVMS